MFNRKPIVVYLSVDGTLHYTRDKAMEWDRDDVRICKQLNISIDHITDIGRILNRNKDFFQELITNWPTVGWLDRLGHRLFL